MNDSVRLIFHDEGIWSLGERLPNNRVVNASDNTNRHTCEYLWFSPVEFLYVICRSSILADQVSLGLSLRCVVIVNLLS